MKHLSAIIAAISLLCSCSPATVADSIEDTEQCSDTNIKKTVKRKAANAIYYWKTVFDLNYWDKCFLKEHDVKRMYIRFFDVVADDVDINGTEQVVPNATIRFKTTPRDIEVIPTVYITLPALKEVEGRENYLAGKIARRVVNMCSYNEIDSVKELQLDCDWTPSTENAYFRLCRYTRDSLRSLVPRSKLSATIRLHQLKKAAPPVDRGVLMVYNTGSFKNPDAENSIISYKDVEPYLRDKITYKLPLDFAYPTYSWGLVYRNGKFVTLLRDTDIFNSTNSSVDYSAQKKRYTLKKDMVPEGKKLKKGDVIRIEKSEFDNVAKVKQLVESQIMHKTKRSVILYHLDYLNLSNYNKNEIDSLYNYRGN